MIDFAITAEDGVAIPPVRSRGRPKDAILKGHIQKFLAMEVGSSFFVENAKRKDLEFLRKPVVALGANIQIVEVKSDPIFHLPGTRVWRLSGLIDEI